MDHTDVVIIGAGVVGLAVAAEIASRYPDYQVIVFERNEQFGQETSSRNSEVIHSGIYYPAGSLKTELCVEGNRLLYDYLNRWNLPYRRTGKLVIAIKDVDIISLEDLARKAEVNKIRDVRLLDLQEIKKLEPHIRVKGALLVPSTGILDTHALSRRLEQQILQDGGFIAYCHDTKNIEPASDGYIVEFTNPDGTVDAIRCNWLINSAGLYADQVASWVGIDPEKEGYKIHFCKGEYFGVSFSKSKLVNTLIYPPPLAELEGLGVHVTKTIDGRMRLGPNTLYVDKLDYDVDPAHAGDFFNSINEFLPFIDIEDLVPDMAGIRPKLQGPGESFRDFIIRHETDRGLHGVINLVGIESPGLTSCLSIARFVADFLKS